jgi:predicted AlkP superfamily phosphohydrolase/phosphomutase
MPARVLVLGFDAADAGLLRAEAERGVPPTISRLLREAAELRLENTLSTLPGAIWPGIACGRISGAGIDAFTTAGTVCDLAPTSLDLIDVVPPADLDGRSLLRSSVVG